MVRVFNLSSRVSLDQSGEKKKLERDLRVLVTRPIQDGESTARRLEAMGHQPLLAPLIAVKFLEAAVDLTGVQAILATSANGVRAFAASNPRRDLPLFAVGSRTADEARRSGFAAVKSADGDARMLASAVADWVRPQAGSLLHAAGEEAGDELSRLLAEKGFRVTQKRLYRMEALELADDARNAFREDRIDAALFFSANSARLFARCIARERLSTARLIAACISRNAADALEGLSFGEIRVARAPNQEALLASL